MFSNPEKFVSLILKMSEQDVSLKRSERDILPIAMHSLNRKSSHFIFIFFIHFLFFLIMKVAPFYVFAIVDDFSYLIIFLIANFFISIFTEGPFVFGLYKISLMTANHQSIHFSNVFDGFSNLSNTLKLGVIFSILDLLLIVFPFGTVIALILRFLFYMAPFILSDIPKMPVNNAILSSFSLIWGQKLRIIGLNTPFIFFYILILLFIASLDMAITDPRSYFQYFDSNIPIIEMFLRMIHLKSRMNEPIIIVPCVLILVILFILFFVITFHFVSMAEFYIQLKKKNRISSGTFPRSPSPISSRYLSPITSRSPTPISSRSPTPTRSRSHS